MNWEYKSMTIPYESAFNNADLTFNEELKKLNQEGWEVVSAAPVAAHWYSTMPYIKSVFIFVKRPIM